MSHRNANVVRLNDAKTGEVKEWRWSGRDTVLKGADMHAEQEWEVDPFRMALDIAHALEFVLRSSLEVGDHVEITVGRMSTRDWVQHDQKVQFEQRHGSTATNIEQAEQIGRLQAELDSARAQVRSLGEQKQEWTQKAIAEQEAHESARNALRTAQSEVHRLREEGTPGVMHEVDKAFYKLTVTQRDGAWREIERMKDGTVLAPPMLHLLADDIEIDARDRATHLNHVGCIQRIGAHLSASGEEQVVYHDGHRAKDGSYTGQVFDVYVIGYSGTDSDA